MISKTLIHLYRLIIFYSFQKKNHIAGHSLRLFSGSIPSSGRLQVFLSANKLWSDVCYDSNTWTIQDSLVVCRQLGYDRVVNTAGEKVHCNYNINTRCRVRKTVITVRTFRYFFHQ